MVYNMPMPLISGVHIDNFRGLRDFHLEGARMFNLLVGPSEIGKTSVLEAIFLMSLVGNMKNCVVLNRLRGAIVDNKRDAIAATASFFHHFQPLPILLGADTVLGKNGAARLDVEIVPILGNNVVSYQDTGAFGIQKNPGSFLDADGRFDGLKCFVRMSGGVAGSGYSISRIGDNDIQPEPFVVEEELYRADGKKGKIPYSEFSEEDRDGLRINPFFISFPSPGPALENVLTNKKKDDIIKVLGRVNPNITDMAMIKDRAHVDIGLERMVSMHIVGDGVRRTLTTLGHLCVKEYNIYLEDEIGAGVYFSAQKEYLRAVLQFAKQEGKQIFATTHSKDILTALKKVLAEDADLRDDVAVFSFMHSKRGNVRATPYLYEDIDRCLDSDIEIR